MLLFLNISWKHSLRGIVCFFSFFQKKLNSRNVYIWLHFTQKKTQICFLPATGCVKNVYGSILSKTKPRFFFACSGLCQKCVYMAAFCPKKKNSPAARCVKNVYIWHHFAQNRNTFFSPKILFPNWHRFQKSKEIFYSFKMCLYGINLCIWSLTK